MQYKNQGDHAPDNVKFPDRSRHSSEALSMLSVTHIMPVLIHSAPETCQHVPNNTTAQATDMLTRSVLIAFSK